MKGEKRESSGMQRGKAFRVVLKTIAWISALFFPVYCSLVMDYMNFYQYDGFRTIADFLSKHPYSCWFALTVLFVLFVFCILICRKLWISALVLGAVSFAMAYANFAKVSQNGNHLFPRDVLMLKNPGEMVSFVSSAPPKAYVIMGIAALVWILILAISGAELPLKWFIRCPAALVMAIVLAFSLSSHDTSLKLLEKYQLSYNTAALQSSNYKANGFTAAFTVNLLSMRIQEPENYSKEYMTELMSEFKGSDCPAADSGEEACDVIVVLCESFSDIRKLPGVTFSSDPMSNFDRIIESDNCISGRMFTNAIGGGTVSPEFEVLTGLTDRIFPPGGIPYEYISNDVESYVSHFADMGYHTDALHLYDRTFYNRDSAYPYLGFDKYYALDDIKKLVGEPLYKRSYASDDSTLEAIRKIMDGEDEPEFLSVVTIENHQPYEELDDSSIKIQVNCDSLDDETMTALSTYTQGLYDSDCMLGELVEYVDSRKRPTLLVFYGDHLPSLGVNFAAYTETGYFEKNTDPKNRERMYSTPFLIYSNRSLNSSMIPEKKGCVISTYNLMNAALEAAGIARTPYMMALEAFYREQPAYSTVMCIPDTEAIKKYWNLMKYVSYDRVVGERYSCDKLK